MKADVNTTVADEPGVAHGRVLPVRRLFREPELGFAQWIDADNTREFSQLITEGLAALKVVAAGD